jgi:hypothetical protein
MTPSTGGFPVPVNRTVAVGVPQQFYLFDELAGVARSAGLDGRYIYIGAFDRHQRMPPDERRDRAKVNEAVRDGLKAWPVAARRECGPITGLAPAAILVLQGPENLRP